jgi:hypothetical protein
MKVLQYDQLHKMPIILLLPLVGDTVCIHRWQYNQPPRLGFFFSFRFYALFEELLPCKESKEDAVAQALLAYIRMYPRSDLRQLSSSSSSSSIQDCTLEKSDE